eukprot:1180229-Prorocentrum_minimum.AAC.4
MAVEFRERAWLVGAEGGRTERWLRQHNLTLVLADELMHETLPPARDGFPAVPPPGREHEVMAMHADEVAFSHPLDALLTPS